MKSFLQRLGKSKLIAIGFKLGLTLAAFAYVFSSIDIEHLALIMANQDRLLLAAAGLLIICQLFLGAIRGQLITVAICNNDKNAMTIGQSLEYYYISSFFNCCLPGTVGGDVVRVWLAKSARLPLSLAIYSVVIDRLLSLLALGVLIIILLPVFSQLAGFTLLPVILTSVAAVIAGLLFACYFERLFSRFKTLRLFQLVSYFIGCLRMLMLHKKASLLSLLFGVIAHLSYCLAGLMLARSLAIEMSLIHAVTLLPVVLLATTMPISIGGWGVREASAVALLGLIGVSKAGALLLSVQIGLLNIIISLPAGLLWLRNRRHHGNAV